MVALTLICSILLTLVDDCATELYQAIEAREWDFVSSMFSQGHRLCLPLSQQVRTWVVRKEETGKIRWRLLPLHAAVIFRAPFRIVDCLLAAYPAAAGFKDDQGMLPLHLAFRQAPVVDFRIMEEILISYPAGLTVRDAKGRTPLEASQASPTSNFMQLFAQVLIGSAKQEWHQEQAKSNAALAASLAVDEKATAQRAKAEAATEYAAKLTELKDEFEKELTIKESVIENQRLEMEDLKIQLEELTLRNALQSTRALPEAPVVVTREAPSVAAPDAVFAELETYRTHNEELKLLVKNLLEQQAAWARQLQGWSQQQKKTYKARAVLLEKLSTLDEEPSNSDEISHGHNSQPPKSAGVKTHIAQEEWTDDVQRSHSRMAERFGEILSKQDPMGVTMEEKKMDYN
jgi:hypothetical protein